LPYSFPDCLVWYYVGSGSATIMFSSCASGAAMSSPIGAATCVGTGVTTSAAICFGICVATGTCTVSGSGAAMGSPIVAVTGAATCVGTGVTTSAATCVGTGAATGTGSIGGATGAVIGPSYCCYY
jgi:hypothetical protein